jgi:hypothetical protein
MARRPRRAAGGEEFIRGLVQSNSFVIAKVCTERPRGLSVSFASEFFLSGRTTLAVHRSELNSRPENRVQPPAAPR